jgi:hypothetical protein
LPRFEFESRKFPWFYLYYLSWLDIRVCLSHDVHVIGAAWQAAMRIVAGVGDLMQRIGDGQAQVGYSVPRRSRGRLTLCAVCTVHKEMRSAGFLVQHQNQGQHFFSGLVSKPLRQFVSGLISKPLGRFLEV